MSNLNFMCVADAVRNTQGVFDDALRESVTVAVAGLSVDDLRQAFFDYESVAGLDATDELTKKAA